MDIKLKARLAAYAKVETLRSQQSDNTNADCALLSTGPVREERIDTLFYTNAPTTEEQKKSTGVSLIDSLFEGK